MYSAGSESDLARQPLPAYSMRQSRMTDFFPRIGNALTAKTPRPARNPQKQVRLSFLSLPRTVRENVYEYAGVPTQTLIELNRWTKDDHLSALGDDSDSGTDYYQAAVPYGLLASSRVVHDEVEDKIYSSNFFATSLWFPRGLQPLEQLSDAALGKLRYLVIFLCPCSCLEPFCGRISYQTDAARDCLRGYFLEHEYRPPKGHSRQLDCISPRDKGTITQWKRICTRLASNVPPGQLELYLKVDVANSRIAHMVLEPLLDIPILKNAAVSLRDEPNENLQALARRTSLRLMGISEEQPCQPFRFLNLPFDLQLEILKLTHLNVPHQIRWNPSERFSSIDWVSCTGQESDWAQHHMIQPEVFCRKRAAAFSKHCECGGSPVRDYFLVSKAFSAVARVVFYSQNKFEVVPSEWYPLREVASDADDEADPHNKYKFVISSFFARMQPTGIQSLLHVSLVFPPITSTYLRPEQKAWGAWLHAIDLLEQHANLPGLKLEIHFADLDVMPLEDLSARRIRSKPEEEKKMFDTYVRILRPLKRLAGLKALFVHVAWPTHKDAEVDRKADEVKLEQMVMGDGYNSANWGKCERSSWSQPDRFWWTQYH